MGSLFFKNRVPDGSKLCLRIEEAQDTPGGSFIGSARLVVDDEGGSEEIWDDAQVHPGPKCQKLTAPKGYAWRVRVAFVSSKTERAVIRAEVIKPDGSVFGDDYEFEVAGKNDDTRRATLMIVTEQ